MNWNAIIEKVAPLIVKIETPSGHGTGFLCFYNETRSFCGIATAHHVISHAERWQEPIRVSHYTSSTTTFLKESDRIVWPDEDKDSAVILLSVGNLKLPEEPIPLLPTDNKLPIGVEVAWLGYPALAAFTLCFFSGNISARQDFRNAYLIDGVAINGVSGGPVIYSPDATGANIQIVGSISAYRANRATGEALPGLSIAQDVSHFQASLSSIRTYDEANRQKTEAAAAASQGVSTEAQPAPAIPAEPAGDNVPQNREKIPPVADTAEAGK